MAQETIQHIWQQLPNITKLETRHQSPQKTLTATASVTTHLSNQEIHFHEKGQWGTGLSFSNHIIWQLTPSGLQLSHKRHQFTPLLLFNTSPTPNQLTASTPHICGEDTYCATLALNQDNIELLWTIKGPKKNDTLQVLYLR